MPSPQVARRQPFVHESVSVMFPSSHCSPGSTTPFPQRADVPLQTYDVAVTSPSSRTPFRFVSMPKDSLTPPAEQFAPAGSGVEATRLDAPSLPVGPVGPVSPVTPLQMNDVLVTSPASSTPLPSESAPEVNLTPPAAQFGPAGSGDATTSVVRPFGP